MQPKSIKKIWQQNLHKIYLPKIQHFIAELLMILAADLQQLEQMQAKQQLVMPTLSAEKKNIIDMLSKSVDLIDRLHKFIYAAKDEAIEIPMIDDDQKIIDAFIGKILAKDLHAE